MMVCGIGLMGIAACNDDETGKGNSNAKNRFAITVSDITPRGARIAVAPRDKTLAYYYDVITEKSLAENYGNDVEKAFRSGLQQIIDRYAASYTPAEVLEAIRSVGNDAHTYRSLGDETKYRVLAAGISASAIGTTTAVESFAFETTPLLENAFTFSDIATTDLTVHATITPGNAAIPYVAYLVEEEDFRAGGQSAEAFLDATTQDAIAYATGLGVALEDAVDALTQTGAGAVDEAKLAPGVDYLILTAGVNEAGYVITEAGSQPVRTADPRHSEMTFEFRVSELSPTGAVVSFIPSVKNDRYFFDIAEASELEGLSEEAIIAQRIGLAGSYIGFYTTYDDYDNDMRTYLDPGTEYVALAFGYISYTTTGLFRSAPFTTPSEQYTQDFGACTADFHGDRYGVGRGNWLLKLTASDNSYTLTADCIGGATGLFADGIPAGEYVFADTDAKGAFTILPGRSAVTLKGDGSSAALASGKITVAYPEGVCTVTTDVVDTQGHQLKGTFTGTPAGTDYSGYPAIGQIVFAQATFYGNGNWFVNLYDYPLQDNPGDDTYYLAFDLYVSPENTSYAQGLPTGTFDVVASGLGVRDNGDTKLSFDSRKLCNIDSGTLTVGRAADGQYTVTFRGACPLTDIDVRFTGTVGLKTLGTSSLAAAKDGIHAPAVAVAAAPQRPASVPRNTTPASARKAAAAAASLRQGAPAKAVRPAGPRIPDTGGCQRRFDL